MINKKIYGNLLLFAVGLAILVVVLGAFTRLADAGLGCPDWPGCYGHIMAPLTEAEIAAAEEAHPWRPVEVSKAIKEMVHRYFAGGLILTVFVLTILAWRHREDKDAPVRTITFIMGLILLQAVLGMWTVTWKLNPLVVTGHLLGGFMTLALLWLLVIHVGRVDLSSAATASARMYLAAIIGLIIVVLQIALGGWTSANYAALACADFPMCQEQWWPPMDWSEGFILWRGTGQNYEFGVLNHDARTAIHMAHRMGALIVLAYLGVLMVAIMKSDVSRTLKKIAGTVVMLLLLQVLLGISNIVFALPLVVATAHNAVGAMLLLGMVSLVYSMYPRWRQPD